MSKFKRFYGRYGEIIRYIFFGALTTLVAFVTYYFTFVISELALGIPLDDKTDLPYILVYGTAQALQWIFAVLFAFYTNKKWVFQNADKDVSTIKQLLVFSSGRVVTLGLDVILTYLGILIFDAVMQGGNLHISVWFVSLDLDAEFFTKVIVSVVVLAANYLISKIFVFKNKK